MHKNAMISFCIENQSWAWSIVKIIFNSERNLHDQSSSSKGKNFKKLIILHETTWTYRGNYFL